MKEKSNSENPDNTYGPLLMELIKKYQDRNDEEGLKELESIFKQKPKKEGK